MPLSCRRDTRATNALRVNEPGAASPPAAGAGRRPGEERGGERGGRSEREGGRESCGESDRQEQGPADSGLAFVRRYSASQTFGETAARRRKKIEVIDRTASSRRWGGDGKGRGVCVPAARRTRSQGHDVWLGHEATTAIVNPRSAPTPHVLRIS